MPNRLEFSCTGSKAKGSGFDWINIDRGPERVGKVRVKFEEESVTIFSLTIFPGFERRGFGRAAVDVFKARCGRITADRVRPAARDFWQKMGFVPNDRGDYMYCRPGVSPDEGRAAERGD